MISFNFRQSLKEIFLSSVIVLTILSQVRAGNVLIYGPMMRSYLPNEQSIAQAAGHTVTVVNAATWSSMTTAQFAAYNSIIIPDDDSSFAGNLYYKLMLLDSTKTVWAPAVTGKICLLASHPLGNQTGQYQG